MNKKNVVVMIPIQNENNYTTDLIGNLVNDVFKKTSNYNMKILLINNISNSNDIIKIENIIKTFDNVNLLKIDNKNKIYIGYKYAVNELNADVVIELDEEYRTSPGIIINFLEEIDNGFDCILGARKYGKRKISDIISSLIIRFSIFFPFDNFFKIKDPATGIKALSIPYIYNKYNLENKISARIKRLHQIVEAGAKVKEIPIDFEKNENDESQYETEKKSEIFKTLIGCRFRDKKTRRFFKFGVTGFIGFIVNSVFLEVFARTGFTTIIANKFSFLHETFILGVLAKKSSWSAAIATEISIFSNFMFNNFWTFHDKKIKNIGKMILKFLQFNLTSIGAVIIMFFVIGMTTLLFGDTMLVRQLSLIFSIAFLVIPYNWMMYNLIIWRKKK